MDGLFRLDTFLHHANVAVTNIMQMLWYKRLGHLNHYSMKLFKNGLVTGINNTNSKTYIHCESCIKGSHARKHVFYNKTKEVTKDRLDLIHSDLVGPIEVES